MADFLLVERRGDVTLITINRPEARNALTVEQFEAFEAAVRSSGDVGAVVLTGTDPAFCAGRDLKEMAVTNGIAVVPSSPAASDSICAWKHCTIRGVSMYNTTS